MNREILFRGKQINNEKWHYGDLLKFGNKRYINICPRFVDEYIVEEDKIALYSFGNFIEVIPETIGRYTGLTDRNGVKIFEGDIVIFNRGRNLPNTDKSPEVIIYNQGDCAFQRYPYCRCITKSGAGKLIQPDMMSECEVIGNIYDNPELLKGE